MANTSRAPIARPIVGGAIVGLVASIVMAMFAMIAALTYQGTGFFTPVYHIASTLISADAMETSMARAGQGSDFYFTVGPALLGLLVHMMTGLIWGVVFGLIAWRVGLRGVAAPVVGIVFGLAVLVVDSFVFLPIAASLFGGGSRISDMPQMVGWGTFTIEHVLYGIVVGLWPLLRPRDVSVAGRAGLAATEARPRAALPADLPIDDTARA